MALFIATLVSCKADKETPEAIDNYNDLFKCGCKEIKESPEKIYKYMGYSYRQLGLYDSAAYTFDQGLKYIQEDIELLKYAGENAGKLNKIEKQIYYYDKILYSLRPTSAIETAENINATLEDLARLGKTSAKMLETRCLKKYQKKSNTNSGKNLL